MSDGAAAAVTAAVPTGEKATEKVAAEFVELTRTLNLDSDSLESGKHLYIRIRNLGITPLPEADNQVVLQRWSALPFDVRVWSACALFLTTAKLEWTGIKLDQLLRVCGLRFLTFFDNLDLLLKSPDIQQQHADSAASLAALKATFLFDSLLHGKFEELWHIRDKLAEKGFVSKRGKQEVETNLMHFTWYLFIICKRHIDVSTLADQYYLLTAVVSIIMEAHSAHKPYVLGAIVSAEDRSARSADDRSTGGTDGASLSSTSSSSSSSDKPVLRADSVVNMFVDNAFGGSNPSFREEVTELVGLVQQHVETLAGGKFALQQPNDPPRCLPNGTSTDLMRKITDPKSLAYNSYQLAKAYEDQFLCSVTDLDESVFLQPDTLAILATPSKKRQKPPSREVGSSQRRLFQQPGGTPPGNSASLVPQSPPSLGLSRRIHNVSSPMASPMGPGHVIQTPVSAAVQQTAWVRHTLKNLPDSASDEVRAAFAECTEPGTITRAQREIRTMSQHFAGNPDGAAGGGGTLRKSLDLSDAGGSSSVPGSDGAAADATSRSRMSTARGPRMKVRRRLVRASTDEAAAGRAASRQLQRLMANARRLFWRVTMEIVEAEKARISASDATHVRQRLEAMLSSIDFHRGLFACCIEVLAAANGMVEAIFPAVLQRVPPLKALDMYAVIETFVLREPTLPRRLRQHLRWCEESILERVAWAPSSGLIPRLAAARAEMAHVLESERESVPQNFAGPADSTAPGTTKITKATAVPPLLLNFCKKLQQVAAQRIRNLCSALQLVDTAMMDQVWTLFRYILYKKWWILQDRHLDQIVLCCVYSICRVHNLNVTFHAIIEKYNLMPALRSPACDAAAVSVHVKRREIIRQISLTLGSDAQMKLPRAAPPAGNIIQFYNLVFVQAMKHIVLRFKDSSDSALPRSPLRHALPQPNLRPSNQQRVVAGSNVYVSASPQLAPHPTPRTRALRCEISIGAIGSAPQAHIRLANQAIKRKLSHDGSEDNTEGVAAAVGAGAAASSDAGAPSHVHKRFRRMRSSAAAQSGVDA